MKSLSISVLLLFFFHYSVAQTNPNSVQSGMPVEMLFPGGKSKALLLSYDDGRTEDRQLVKLMNKYKVIGTFHLNSNKLGTKDYLTKEEIKELYAGHEVSVHSFNHPNLTTLSKPDIVYEVIEDRKELERLVNYPVRGMAYPFGNNNQVVLDAIHGLGIEYARTVDDTYNFKIPENFLMWHPTVHQFAKAHWEPNQPEKDAKELAHFYQIITDFLQTKELAVLDIWGHSWEMGNNPAYWEETEKFIKMVANNPSIHYTTQIDLVDYINAFRNLKFSVDKKMVYNPSALPLYFNFNGKTYSVLGGKTLILSKE
ncbi:polysaccharide deacetylase family protein [Flavobacterium sp. N1994]|uniref:polysaccharide deacetylase family protein n=1 Tax=Flavobacterium sp. N1994 TaxID=2986827 RepID=UPI002223BF60|nr:polysaccharide deacetylase family protein [Flavobacterium sp. N1994]